MKISHRKFIALSSFVEAGISLRQNTQPLKPPEGKAKVFIAAAENKQASIKQLLENFHLEN
ncbi:MAG: hypothetical protein QXZ53_02425 [Candidatus Bathyarchaeia archaeon]